MTTTVVKTVGTTSRNFSTTQSWEDGAPANLTTAAKYTCGTFSGAFTQGETVTGGTSGKTGKMLDSDGSSYMVIGDASGAFTNGETLTGGTSGKTCVITTPATDSGGVIWQGQCYNDSQFTAALNISGSTASSTCYKELTTASGQSFVDNANKLTNALKYNQSNGVGISTNIGYTETVAINENYARISKLQIQQANTASTGLRLSNGSTNNTGSQLIVEANSNSPVVTFGDAKIINSLLISTKSGGSQIATVSYPSGGGGFYNCSLVAPSDLASKVTNGINGNNSVTVKNCAIFGATNAANFSTGAAGSGFNGTDVATGIGSSNQTSLTYTSQFQNTTTASRDFRAASGGSLPNNGTPDTTNTGGIDIVGQTRNASTPTIGAWEYIAAGGGGSGVVTFNPPLMGGFGHGIAAGMQG